MDAFAQDENMSALDPNTMDTTGLGQTQTLHQIISQNNEELMRRRNTYQQPQFRGSHDHGRRASMLEFTSALDSDLANFQFDPNPNEPDLSMAPSAANMLPMQKTLDPRRVRSREDLSLNTRFSQMNTSFDSVSAVPSFSPVVMSSTSGGVEPSTAYLPPTMDIPMDFDSMAGNASAANMHSGPLQESMFTTSPIDQSFSMSFQSTSHDPGGGSISPAQMQGQMVSMPQAMASIPRPFPIPGQGLRTSTPVSASVPMAVGPASTMASSAPHRRLSMEVGTPYSAGGKENVKRQIEIVMLMYLLQI